ncbi:MAG: GNAT family N-acetyltransferase [Anaerolineaceae bacterium]|nr:GNAT family N-acetyltransferase [Anaerolineaceae bacterium]
MAELAHSSTLIEPHLRPLDVRRDLVGVANLIEVCFAATMDPDGREYLRQMREYADEDGSINWAGRSFLGPWSMSGFVWLENEAIIGNLTLIPVYKQLQRVYLIANVAVHPDYRRRGIGRLLTQAAIDHARQHSAASAWLQVRAENESAYRLYQSLGFIERARRDTWIGERDLPTISPDPEIQVTPRRNREWPVELTWLQQVYPSAVIWNLPLSIGRLKPSLLNNFFRFLASEQSGHWSARTHSGLIGTASWEPSRSFADNIWLATSPEYEERAIRSLLPLIRKSVATRRPLAVNYPADRAPAAFNDAGFRLQQTLVWMEEPFTLQP